MHPDGSTVWQVFDGRRIVAPVNLTDDTRTVTVTPEGRQPFVITPAPASAVIREL